MALPTFLINLNKKYDNVQEPLRFFITMLILLPILAMMSCPHQMVNLAGIFLILGLVAIRLKYFG